MKKGLTQAERLNIYRKALMHQVIELLKWTELEYCDHMNLMGLKYLDRMMPFADQRDMLAVSKEFWGWWKLQWYVREQEFVGWCNMATDGSGLYVRSDGQMVELLALALPKGTPVAMQHTLKGRNDEYLLRHDYRRLAADPDTEASYCRDFQLIIKAA